MGAALWDAGLHNVRWNPCWLVSEMDRLDDVRSICVEPNGDIPVCDWVLGNVAREDVNEILARYDPYADPTMKLILEEGVEGPARQARAMGIALREEGYYAICDLCKSLRAHLRAIPRL